MACGCFPAVQEITLINDCYPPSKALISSGPDYKPLSSDLSKLVYRCTNQSSKLVKVGEELDKRVAKEVTRSSGGYQKSRASLLISLSIVRTLISECKRDLAVFSRSIVRIVNSSLDTKVYQKGNPDLEVIGRAASCFIAYTTYTDGVAVSTDDQTGSNYLSILKKFEAFSKATVQAGEKVDTEQTNRTRLVGLAALNGAASSDALFSASNSNFPRQAAILVPGICSNIFEGTMSALKLETSKIEMDTSPSPFFSEFSARRPVNDRRAPSLHAHIPGEKGPTELDVLSAALRGLRSLVRQCNLVQGTQLIDGVAAFLDKTGWTDVERSCWLAERLAALMSLQYRFVIPTRLVELLIAERDGPSTHKSTTLLAMVITILNSSTSLVGLGVTEFTNNLITLIVRRIQVDPQDGLLPPLVEAIASLGTHIYYADQINDIVEEIAIRMSQIDPQDPERSEIIRVLIYAMIGVMKTAVMADEAEMKATAQPETPSTTESPEKTEKSKGKAPALDTGLSGPQTRRTGRRNFISPQIWQETLPLLCESAYAVRAAYAHALQLYLRHEMPKENPTARPPGDIRIYRFCNALNAAVYTLAMSSCLGIGSGGGIASPEESPEVTSKGDADVKDAAATSASPEKEAGDRKANEGSLLAEMPKSESPKPTNGSAAAQKGVSFNITEATPTSSTPIEPSTGRATPKSANGGSNTPRKGGTTPPRKASRTRRVSLPLNRLNSGLVVASFENVATPFDFTAIIHILDALQDAVPNAALLTGVPMLLALDRDASTELVRRPGDGRQAAQVNERKRCIREVVAIVWRRLGRKWAVSSVMEYADKTLNTLPEPFEVPNGPAQPEGVLPPPETAFEFVHSDLEGESSASTQPFLDPETLMSAFVASPGVSKTLGEDGAMLRKRFETKWTVETALKDSVERYSSAQLSPLPADPHFDVAAVLMSMRNPSYQSIGRPASRAVDVTDLREALGGRIRNDSIQGSSPPSIISTTTGARSMEEVPKKRLQNSDVQEVLKDIFKNTKRKGGAVRKNFESALNPSALGGKLSNGDAKSFKTSAGAPLGGSTGSTGAGGANGVELGVPKETQKAS